MNQRPTREQYGMLILAGFTEHTAGATPEGGVVTRFDLDGTSYEVVQQPPGVPAIEPDDLDAAMNEAWALVERVEAGDAIAAHEPNENDPEAPQSIEERQAAKDLADAVARVARLHATAEPLWSCGSCGHRWRPTSMLADDGHPSGPPCPSCGTRMHDRSGARAAR